MSQANRYDLIIVGAGAGGATLAQALAPSGKQILLLERGGYLPREKDNWDAQAVFVDSKYKTKEEWYDKDGRPFHPGTHYYVGGNTKFYGAALLRFRGEDFGELKHYGGISPAWPLSYDDFEPYYTRAEQLYQVHGERGADPTEPPASTPYAYPPISHEPRVQGLYDDLSRIGNRPFPLPLGIMLDEDKPHRSRCIRCDTCDGFPCLVNAKSDAHIICVERSLASPNLTLHTHAYVQRLETDTSGREVKKVIVERDGAVEEYSADIVVVACGAINSAALLLRSAQDKHPNGLANSSGVVGRHYMAHNNLAFIAISHRPNPTVFEKTIGLNDYYFGVDDWPYPMGHVQMLGKSKPAMLAADAPKYTPRKALDVMAQHSLDLWVASEDLPDSENRVTLNSQGRIVLKYTENNMEGHKRLIAKLKSLLTKVGCEDRLLPCSIYLGKKIPIAGVAHQCGTIRFGRDPESSALDLNCKAHDLDNLYVVDGSFFVSSSACNPALTIIANALRVSEHLIERLK
ncbi:MAG: GMC family oxidoreductase [Chloroflexi bacterium]|nr:GMC family oxidoreductase [Chloroflexota bacterium]